MKTVYLCGGIMNLSTNEQKDWRENAKEQLIRFNKLDPMRNNFRDLEQEHRNEIIGFCKKDIIDSDILLVNATKPSWGTAMEIMFAFERNKIIVAFTGNDFEKTSPWVIFHSTRICKTLEEALEYINRHF